MHKIVKEFLQDIKIQIVSVEIFPTVRRNQHFFNNKNNF